MVVKITPRLLWDKICRLQVRLISQVAPRNQLVAVYQLLKHSSGPIIPGSPTWWLLHKTYLVFPLAYPTAQGNWRPRRWKKISAGFWSSIWPVAFVQMGFRVLPRSKGRSFSPRLGTYIRIIALRFPWMWISWHLSLQYKSGQSIVADSANHCFHLITHSLISSFLAVRYFIPIAISHFIFIFISLFFSYVFCSSFPLFLLHLYWTIFELWMDRRPWVRNLLGKLSRIACMNAWIGAWSGLCLASFCPV